MRTLLITVLVSCSLILLSGEKKAQDSKPGGAGDIIINTGSYILNKTEIHQKCTCEGDCYECYGNNCFKRGDPIEGLLPIPKNWHGVPAIKISKDENEDKIQCLHFGSEIQSMVDKGYYIVCPQSLFFAGKTVGICPTLEGDLKGGVKGCNMCDAEGNSCK